MSDDDAALDEARRTAAFIDASPSPYHAVATASARLEAVGFTLIDEADPWPGGAGRFQLVRGGSLVAWQQGGPPAEQGFRVVGAHTDSPNLRIKPNPDAGAAGCRQLGVEVYGGALWNSWLDRDLGLSGRVSIRGREGLRTELVRIDRPLLRIPQLAIHLDRGVNDNGLKLNPQQHLSPLWGLGPVDHELFRSVLAEELGTAPEAITAWEVMLHDLEPSRLAGLHDELLSAPRIDNLASCHAALRGLELACDGLPEGGPLPVVCLFDHEEIGSQSASGADSTLLANVLERIVLATGGTRDDLHRAAARSACLSADGAHATNPNYPERHEPAHHIELGAGPVLKVNSNLRYATDATSGGLVADAADRAGVALQRFVVRTDTGCGSTIGPVTAARLGIATADVGIPQLAMHSSRELCGSHDPDAFVRLLTHWFQP